MPFSINKQIEIGRARPVPCRSADKKGPVRSACSWVADCSLSSSSRLFIAGKVTVLWLKVPGPLPLYSQNPYHASMTEIEAFGRYRDRAGLTAKYLSANRHLITLHSFRSYFFTRARRVHDTDIAHAMVGHTTYLGMYDRKDDLEKLQLCLEVEPSLQINFPCHTYMKDDAPTRPPLLSKEGIFKSEQYSQSKAIWRSDGSSIRLHIDN